MTKFKLTTTALLLFGALLSSTTGLAQSRYAATGKIFAINNSILNLSDVQFKLSPTVKVRLDQGAEGKLSDLKVGNQVGIKMIRLDNRLLVDSIHIISQLDANEDDPSPSN